MSQNIARIFESIENDRFAMQGFEEGTLEGTRQAITLIREAFPTLAANEDVAVVPTGSRIKGYADNDSDLDLLVIANKGVNVDQLRSEIDDIVFSATGICTRHGQDGFVEPDEMLTYYMSDFQGDGDETLALLRAVTISASLGGRALIGLNLVEQDLSLSVDRLESVGFQQLMTAQYNKLFVSAKEGHELGERLVDTLLLHGHSLDIEFVSETECEPSRLNRFFFPDITQASECFNHDKRDFESLAEVRLKRAYELRLKRFGFESIVI